jgi:hypothetical protein
MTRIQPLYMLVRAATTAKATGHTLYKHPAWKRFRHVLHGFFGRLPSMGLIMLQEASVQTNFVQLEPIHLRITNRTLCLAFEMQRDVLFKQTQPIEDPSVLQPERIRHRTKSIHRSGQLTCDQMLCCTASIHALHRCSSTPTRLTSFTSILCNGQSAGIFNRISN